MKQCRNFHEGRRFETEPVIAAMERTIKKVQSFTQSCKLVAKSVSGRNLSCDRVVLEPTFWKSLNIISNSFSE